MALMTARRLPAHPEEVFTGDLRGLSVPLPCNPQCRDILDRGLRLAQCLDSSDPDCNATVFHIGLTAAGVVAVVPFPLTPGAMYAVE